MHWSAKLVVFILIVATLVLVGLLIYPHGASDTLFKSVVQSKSITRILNADSQLKEVPIVIVDRHSASREELMYHVKNGNAWILLWKPESGNKKNLYIFNDAQSLSVHDKDNSGFLDLHDAQLHEKLYVGAYLDARKKLMYMPAYKAGIAAIIINPEFLKQEKKAQKSLDLDQVGHVITSDSSKSDLKIIFIPGDFLKNLRLLDMSESPSQER